MIGIRECDSLGVQLIFNFWEVRELVTINFFNALLWAS